MCYCTTLPQILGFEDILRPSGDSDFDDLILIVKKTPIPDATETASYNLVTLPADPTVEGRSDSNGLFLWLDATKLDNSKSMVFTRTISFRTTNISYRQNGSMITMSPRDYVLGLTQHLNWNYNQIIITPDKTTNTITQQFTFTQTDIINNTLNGYVKLYLLSKSSNDDNTIVVNGYETNYQILLDYQSIFVDLWYSVVGKSTYVDHEDFDFVSGTTDNKALNSLNTNFQSSSVALLAWGDPYIQRVDGTVYKLPDVQGRYSLLQNNLITIDADTSTSPDTEQILSLKGTTFFSNIYVDLKNKGKFEIDLKTMNFKSEGLVKYSINFDRKIYDQITDCVLLAAITNDPKMSVVNVVIENMNMNFIRLPSIYDVQNIVLFDMNSIKMYATSDSTGLMIN